MEVRVRTAAVRPEAGGKWHGALQRVNDSKVIWRCPHDHDDPLIAEFCGLDYLIEHGVSPEEQELE